MHYVLLRREVSAMPHPHQDQRDAAQRTATRRTAARPGPWRPRGLRALGAGAALVLSAGALTACSGGSGSSLPAPDQPNIKVGVISSIGDVPFLIGTTAGSASGNGAFSKAGLTVTVQPFTDEADEISALDSGSIDIAYGEYGQFFAQNDPLAESDQLRILSAGYDASSGSIVMLVPHSGAIPNYRAILNQSAGTSIAVPDATGPEYLALSAYLNSQGAPISSQIGMGAGAAGTGNNDIKIISDPAAMITALVSGQVNAIVLQEPYATTAEEQYGLVPAVNLATGDSADMPLDGYFASASFISKNPTTAEDFSAVMSRLQAVGASRAEVEAAILAGTTSPSLTEKEYVATMQLGSYPTTTIPAKIEIVGQLMSDAGTISQGLDISSLVYAGT
jgi:NitT/TauT family transport system substrate-binding protein